MEQNVYFKPYFCSLNTKVSLRLIPASRKTSRKFSQAIRNPEKIRLTDMPHHYVSIFKN